MISCLTSLLSPSQQATFALCFSTKSMTTDIKESFKILKTCASQSGLSLPLNLNTSDMDSAHESDDTSDPSKDSESPINKEAEPKEANSALYSRSLFNALSIFVIMFVVTSNVNN